MINASYSGDFAVALKEFFILVLDRLVRDPRLNPKVAPEVEKVSEKPESIVESIKRRLRW